MPIVVSREPLPPRANPAQSSIVPRGIPSTVRSTRAPGPLPIIRDNRPASSTVNAPACTRTDDGPPDLLQPPLDVSVTTSCTDGVDAAANASPERSSARAVRGATLGALIFYADWSEACTEFVPRAVAALTSCAGIAKGAVVEVHVDADPCLCARYAVRAIPCIIFRGRPSGLSWRRHGVARPFEIPHSRIVGACSQAVLAARIDATIASFERIALIDSANPQTRANKK